MQDDLDTEVSGLRWNPHRADFQRAVRRDRYSLLIDRVERQADAQLLRQLEEHIHFAGLIALVSQLDADARGFTGQRGIRLDRDFTFRIDWIARPVQNHRRPIEFAEAADQLRPLPSQGDRFDIHDHIARAQFRAKGWRHDQRGPQRLPRRQNNIRWKQAHLPARSRGVRLELQMNRDWLRERVGTHREFGEIGRAGQQRLPNIDVALADLNGEVGLMQYGLQTPMAYFRWNPVQADFGLTPRRNGDGACADRRKGQTDAKVGESQIDSDGLRHRAGVLHPHANLGGLTGERRIGKDGNLGLGIGGPGRIVEEDDGRFSGRRRDLVDGDREQVSWRANRSRCHQHEKRNDNDHWTTQGQQQTCVSLHHVAPFQQEDNSSDQVCPGWSEPDDAMCRGGTSLLIERRADQFDVSDESLQFQYTPAGKSSADWPSAGR